MRLWRAGSWQKYHVIQRIRSLGNALCLRNCWVENNPIIISHIVTIGIFDLDCQGFLTLVFCEFHRSFLRCRAAAPVPLLLLVSCFMLLLPPNSSDISSVPDIS